MEPAQTEDQPVERGKVSVVEVTMAEVSEPIESSAWNHPMGRLRGQCARWRGRRAPVRGGRHRHPAVLPARWTRVPLRSHRPLQSEASAPN